MHRNVILLALTELLVAPSTLEQSGCEIAYECGGDYQKYLPGGTGCATSI
jgi:hypothetical protein